MKIFVKLCLLALLSASGTLTTAQETKAPASNAFPVGTKPKIQVGQTYLVETYKDWDLMCVKVAKGAEPCQIGQLVMDDKSNPIADIRFFSLPPNSPAIAGATMIMPLGVLLETGLVFGVDDKKPKQYPFVFCNAVGCLARVGFTPVELESLRSGKSGKMTLRMANNPPNAINISLSLKGFSTAFAALTKRMLTQK